MNEYNLTVKDNRTGKIYEECREGSNCVDLVYYEQRDGTTLWAADSTVIEVPKAWPALTPAEQIERIARAWAVMDGREYGEGYLEDARHLLVQAGAIDPATKAPLSEPEAFEWDEA